MTNRIASPFVVRGITGRLVPTFADAWPSGSGAFPATFEIDRAGGSTLSVPIHADGSFDLPVAEGTYCFRISSDVLQGYEGVIVVARGAALDSAVEINVDLGV